MANSNAGGTLIALGLLGVLAYAFRSQISQVVSGLKVGQSTKGAGNLYAPTVNINPFARGNPSTYNNIPGSTSNDPGESDLQFLQAVGDLQEPGQAASTAPNGGVAGGLGVTGSD